MFATNNIVVWGLFSLLFTCAGGVGADRTTLSRYCRDPSRTSPAEGFKILLQDLEGLEYVGASLYGHGRVRGIPTTLALKGGEEVPTKKALCFAFAWGRDREEQADEPAAEIFPFVQARSIDAAELADLLFKAERVLVEAQQLAEESSLVRGDCLTQLELGIPLAVSALINACGAAYALYVWCAGRRRKEVKEEEDGGGMEMEERESERRATDGAVGGARPKPAPRSMKKNTTTGFRLGGSTEVPPGDV